MSSGAKDKHDVLREIESEDVHFIRFWFTDVLGNLKALELTRDEVDNAFSEGMGFDGSSIEGFARIQESDMIAIPDPDTFQILRGRCSGKVSARMFCDIKQPTGEPYEGDPRAALKRMLEKAHDMGYTMNIGPELEFFYFKDRTGPDFIDNGGYFDMQPLDIASDIRRETVLALQETGMVVEYSHHETAPSQHEIDLRYTDALTMADNVMTYRLIVKEVAQAHDTYATFMPKPRTDCAGSGMHVHQSLFTLDGVNAFHDLDDPLGHNLSDVAKHYIAGLLKYAPEYTAVTNQWVNSYKRLVTGFEAPVYITWAHANRSALVRIPLYRPGKASSTRLELRSPDPACNPYLAFAVMLGAGLKGIEEKLELPDEAIGDIHAMSDSERAELGIQTLPGDLGEAIELFDGSELMREILGHHIHEYFVRNKRAEWNEYRSYVSSWEMRRYFPNL